MTCHAPRWEEKLSRVSLVLYNFSVRVHHVFRRLPPVCFDWIGCTPCTLLFTLVCGWFSVSASLVWYIFPASWRIYLQGKQNVLSHDYGKEGRVTTHVWFLSASVIHKQLINSPQQSAEGGRYVLHLLSIVWGMCLLRLWSRGPDPHCCLISVLHNQHTSFAPEHDDSLFYRFSLFSPQVTLDTLFNTTRLLSGTPQVMIGTCPKRARWWCVVINSSKSHVWYTTRLEPKEREKKHSSTPPPHCEACALRLFTKSPASLLLQYLCLSATFLILETKKKSQEQETAAGSQKSRHLWPWRHKVGGGTDRDEGQYAAVWEHSGVYSKSPVAVTAQAGKEG